MDSVYGFFRLRRQGFGGITKKVVLFSALGPASRFHGIEFFVVFDLINQRTNNFCGHCTFTCFFFMLKNLENS